MLSKALQDFYHSTPMREGVLCWYPFERDGAVWDLSGGSLTALLRKRCDRVTSTDKRADIRTVVNKGKLFDYIVLLDPEDFSIEILGALKKSLRPHGRLLLAYENPFALRYWSGKSGPVTGSPYTSLLSLDGLPSKAELQIRLRRAGFEGQRWYYPLTDHWFTNEVYSDAYLPDEYLKHRFMPYVDDDTYLQFDERLLYREVIRGDAFPFMCGAYLVEARADAADAPCPVDFAAITAYRAPARRFATVVYNDDTVRKIPLHPDGQKGVERIKCAHEDLTRMGVDVVPVRLENGALVMPRLHLPTLCDYWAEQLLAGTLDEQAVFRIFDRLRDAIYTAAAGGRCYWEMVPANCFYDAPADKLIFFDQEYYWEDTPPDAAVVRAVQGLDYSPALSADPRSERWRHTLFERYGLGECWELLTQTAVNDTHMEVFGEGTAVLQAMTARAGARVGPVRFLPVAGILREMGFSRPIIYGYGRRGHGLVNILCRVGVTIAAVVDNGVFSLNPDATSLPFPAYATISQALTRHKDADVIIISVRDSASIEADLMGQVNLPVYTVEGLLRGRIE